MNVVELAYKRLTLILIATILGVIIFSAHLDNVADRQTQEARIEREARPSVLFVQWSAVVRQGMASFTAKDLGCATMRDFLSMPLAEQQETLSIKLSQTALRHGVVPITWEECY